MKFKNILIVNVLVLFGLLLFIGTSSAQGIKERMKQRLPTIVALKAQGIVGENNSGYLAFVTGQRNQEALVTSENEDRKAIYAHIAKQQNTSIAVVEKRRAITLSQRAASGEFVQKPNGSWIKK